MKKTLFVFCVAVFCVFLAACAANKSASADIGFSAVEGKTWQLDKATDAKGAAFYKKSASADEFFKDVYTIQFDNGRVSGKAAPNRYNGPYTLGSGNEIAFKNFASTLMAAIRAPEGLSEHQYFKLMSGVSSWRASKGTLTLYSVEDGAKTTLTFKEVK